MLKRENIQASNYLIVQHDVELKIQVWLKFSPCHIGRSDVNN
jgi:hypothetical protein